MDADQQHNYADNIIVAAFRDCLLGFIDHNEKAANDYIQLLFNGTYQTLKRIAIHALDKQFSALKNAVDLVISPEYFHDYYRYELWHFLNNHYRELGDNNQKRVVEIIEKLEVIKTDGNINKLATAYKRSIWLSAIKDYDDEARLYKRYAEAAGTEPDHPDFSSYMTVGWVKDKSPIPIEHLLSLDVVTLIETIDSYKDVESGWFDQPSLEGLVDAFKEVVKTKAGDIYPELLSFESSDLAFIYPLIEAYREMWNEKKDLPWNDAWEHLLNFCLSLVKNDKFWSKENATERSHFVANRHWIVGAIGRLIEDGTKSDGHAFERDLLQKAKEILLVILERQEGSEFALDCNAVSVAINSPRGSCLEALINLSLRSCRLENKEYGNHTNTWSQYRDIYEVELKRSARGEYEFATIVAMFLPNFDYMSRTWVMEHLADIFDQSDYQKWLCAMQGYSYVDRVYEKFYEHLKTNGDFLKALDDPHLKEYVNERIIQSIVIAFIDDLEDIKKTDGLIATLLQRRNSDELRPLIWFVWTLRDKNNEKLIEKVYELWPRLLEVADINTKEGRMLASSLCHWAAFVKKIDPTVESWLLKIAPYAEEDHNASDLLQSLAEISDTQPIEAQKIWIRMLESYSYDFPEESFRRIFRNLVKLGAEGQRKAKEVVDSYVKHGLERPRIWLNEVLTN